MIPTPRILDSAEGCGEVTALCSVGVFGQIGPKCFLNGGRVKVEVLRVGC